MPHYGPLIFEPGLIRVKREEIFLRSENELHLETEVFFNVKHPELSRAEWEKGWMYNGKNYKIVLRRIVNGADLYEDLGMLKRIYEMLWEGISKIYDLGMKPNFFV